MKKRFLLYAGIYVAVMTVTAWLPTWRTADWWIFARLNNRTAPAIANNIMVIDLPYNTNLKLFRTQVAGLLNHMADHPESLPEIVAFDISFSGLDTLGISGLEQAIQRLQATKVAVYAGVDPRKEEGMSGQLDPEYMNRHAQHLYGILYGKGHTAFDHLYGVAKYDPELELTGQMGSEQLQALPVLIATNHFNRPLTTIAEPIVLNLGDPKELRNRSYTFRLRKGNIPTFIHYRQAGGDDAIGSEPDFKGRLVVVGCLDKDKTDFQNLSGPEILAFAISDRILPSESNILPKVLASPILLISLVFGFAVCALSFFKFLFRKWIYCRSKLWLLSAVSIIVCLLIMMLLVLALLKLKYVYPQVSLVGFSILLTIALTWIYTQRDSERKLITLNTENYEAGGDDRLKYDVFISYAHSPENSAWVKKNVYEPLMKIKKSNGTKLSVFFDENDIKPSENWQHKLALGIDASRFFLPIYTTDYFSRKFCQYEMEIAALRREDLKDFIIGIARHNFELPKPYRLINYLDVRNDDKFMARIIEIILDRTDVNPE